ncbi:hypothetical protein BSKO_01695 [Bryopsis sp. KO-2023]|nr:hypothetical protein BSKO_01695 [Bryopsis sp. KO-2023]
MMRPLSLQANAVSSPKCFCGTPVRVGTGCRRVAQSKSVVRMSVVAPPAKLDVVKVDGSAQGTETLSLRVADSDKAKGLVHRYLVKVRRDMREGTACTKTRAEVRGGGRKPYQQKGTGRARRGSQRSPLIVGGGVIFGPKPRDYSVKMNKKERRLALATALQSAVEDIIVCENLTDKFVGKTKQLVGTLAEMGVSPDEYSLVITKDSNPLMERAGKNAPKIVLNTTGQINAYDVLRADKIVIEQDALQHIQDFYGPKSETPAEPQEGSGDE